MSLKTTHVIYLSEVDGQAPLSGAENHLWMLLQGLSAQHVEVELLVVLWKGDHFHQVKQQLEQLRQTGVKVTIIESLPIRDSKLLFWKRLHVWAKLSSELRRNKRSCVHIHLELAYVPFLARASGCKRLICSIHSDEPMYATRLWRTRLHLLNKVVVRYIAISDRVRAHLHSVAHVPFEQISTIHYGVTPPVYQAHARNEYDLPQNVFIVGFVGRLVEPKNLLVLIEALRQRPDVIGVIVGDGPLRGQITNYVEVNHVANVRLLGNIPEAIQLMQLFDVLCLPSRWEGLGLVLIEAMLMRVPIIASTCGAIPEILEYGKYGILFEPTVEGVLTAIDYAKCNKDELTSKAQAAHSYALAHFTIERMVEQTISVYKQVSSVK